MILQGDTKIYAEYTEKGKLVTKDNFILTLDAHVKIAMDLLEKFTDEVLNEKVNLFQMGEMTKGVYLVETVLKWLPAYKMQLFLHIKAMGNTSIGTSNLWGGFDMPAKV